MTRSRSTRYLPLILLVMAWTASFSAVSSPALSAGISERPGWRVLETRHSFLELVEKLAQSIQASGMNLVTQASASDGAAAQGIKIPGNKVFGVYRNDYARRMLSASTAAGIEAPIRFYVSEQDDGTAILSWKTPSFVFSPYLEEGGAALETLGRELDGVFETIGKAAAE